MIRNKKRMEKKADLISFLEKRTGISLINSAWDLRYKRCFDIKVSDLKAIKDVVGEFGDTFGKEMCHDYDETGEIWVTCFVETGLFDGFQFRYRRRLSDGDSCQVKDVVSESFVVPERINRTLVCNKTGM